MPDEVGPFPPVRGFRGPYRFLSNFARTPVTVDGVTYRTLEHGFQAAKTDDATARAAVMAVRSPAAARLRGQTVPLRAGWDQQRLAVMARLLRAKFSDPRLAAALVATGTAEFVEVNTWDDGYWGVCGGQGNNHLGRLLMALRDELLAELGPRQHGVRLAVVGSAARCFTPRTAVLARQRISLAIWRLRPEVIISGGCPKGGVDVWRGTSPACTATRSPAATSSSTFPPTSGGRRTGTRPGTPGSRPTARTCFAWPPAPAAPTVAAGPPTRRSGAAGSSSASGSDRLGDRDRRSARSPTGLTAWPGRWQRTTADPL